MVLINANIYKYAYTSTAIKPKMAKGEKLYENGISKGFDNISR